MIGPKVSQTGRFLAQAASFARAPLLLKVGATKFTEVAMSGVDSRQIIAIGWMWRSFMTREHMREKKKKGGRGGVFFPPKRRIARVWPRKTRVGI